MPTEVNICVTLPAPTGADCPAMQTLARVISQGEFDSCQGFERAFAVFECSDDAYHAVVTRLGQEIEVVFILDHANEDLASKIFEAKGPEGSFEWGWVGWTTMNSVSRPPREMEPVDQKIHAFLKCWLLR